jgi:hypothetical protein
MHIAAKELSGDAYAMHPAAGANLVHLPDRIPNSVMIQIDPVFKMGSVIIAGVVNRLEETAS